MNWNKVFFVSAAIGAVAVSAFAVYQHREVKLESEGSREHRRMDNVKNVRLVRKLSDKPCIYGFSWGYTRDGLWVDRGCRAIFEVEEDRRGGGWNDGGWNGGDRDRDRVKVESDDGRYKSKDVNTRGGVRLVRKLSDAPCVFGRSWGYDRNRIWVDRGCRAVFEVGRRGNDHGGWPGNGGSENDCPSWLPGRYTGHDDGRRLTLSIDRSGRVTLRRDGRDNWDRDENGYYRDGTIYVGNWVYDVDRNGNDLRLRSKWSRDRRIDFRRQ